MAYLSYYGHTREVQLQAARFTWFMIYFDDFCHKFPLLMQGFQRGMLGGTVTDKIPIFKHFRNHLVDMYELWDETPANCINTSAMEYINGCSLEETPSIRKMKLKTNARAWPTYLRTKTGVAAAYGFMIFPRNLHSDISVYIQAIGDICTFIDLTNDVLSFYKETLAGEKTNYIHNRAFISGISVEDTLLEVAQDVLDAHTRIVSTLSTEDAIRCWKNFVNGYLAFHVTQSRYRLQDLGF
uniref:Uncharacterized protein n=1 Tax=Psilocybe cubensis TaxID=181762 RepID=A0A8H7XMP5_PSICU